MGYGVIVSKKVLKKEMERLGYVPAVMVGTEIPVFSREDEFIIDGEVQFEPISFNKFWILVKDKEIYESDDTLGAVTRAHPYVITGKEHKIKPPTPVNMNINAPRRGLVRKAVPSRVRRRI